MKKLWEVLEKDIQQEGFSEKEMVVYGIVVPLGLVIIMGIAGWLETIFA